MTGSNLVALFYLEVRIACWKGCLVAVKMMYEELTTSQHNIDIFLQEITIAWRVHHPNIVSVCGVTLEPDSKTKQSKAWIVMELLQGSIAGVINDSRRRGVGPLSLREKVDVAHDCLCGLNYLHSLVCEYDLVKRDRPMSTHARART